MIATGHLHDLIKRIGSEHVERRLEIETQHEAQLFGQGLLLFNVENWRRAPGLVEFALKASGLYARARRKEMSRSLLNFAKRPLPRLTLRGVGLTSKDAVS